MNPISVPFKKSLLVLMIAASVALTGCGGESAKAPMKSTAAQQKEEGHHDGDHAPEADGKDRHVTGKHDESEHGKAEEGHDDEEKPLSLSAEQIKNAGLEFATAGPAALGEALPLYGTVTPNAERMRDVVARFPGTIRRVDKKIGDSVRQGETLATIESNESLQTYSVVAPLTGVVTVRNANPGEQAAEKSLFTIADFSSVWVELSLFPRDLAKVRVGQPVRIKSTDAGVTAEGKIDYVAPFGSSANQSLTARVVLDNADHRWAPGLYVTADVILSQQTVPIAIRKEAVQTVEGATVVFVRHDDGFEANPVRLGRSDSLYAEVVDGLAAGTTYVTANSFVLKAEMSKGEASHDH